MEFLSVESAAKKIRAYLAHGNFRPYFVISEGGAESAELKKIFSDFVAQIYVSDFCADDSPLDSDIFFEELNALNRDALCFGLGEYIFLTGQENILRALQDKTFKRKIIFLCRGVENLLERLATEDYKFRANQICRVAGEGNFSVVKYAPKLKISTDAQNFSELLKLLENGGQFLTTKTAQDIRRSIGGVSRRDSKIKFPIRT